MVFGISKFCNQNDNLSTPCNCSPATYQQVGTWLPTVPKPFERKFLNSKSFEAFWMKPFRFWRPVKNFEKFEWKLLWLIAFFIQILADFQKSSTDFYDWSLCSFDCHKQFGISLCNFSASLDYARCSRSVFIFDLLTFGFVHIVRCSCHLIISSWY